MKTLLSIIAAVMLLAAFNTTSASACGDVSGCTAGWSNYTYSRAYNYRYLSGISWRSALGYLQYQNIRNSYRGPNYTKIFHGMSDGGRQRAWNSLDPSYGMYSSYHDN